MSTITPSVAGLKPISMSALEDIRGGARNWHVWGRMGLLDIKRRYRRTILGPFWSALTLLIFVIVIGSVGSGLLSKQSSEYLPFLVAGMVVWVMLSNIIIEAGSVFISGAGLIRQLNFEYSMLVYALVWRNFIVFLHNMSIYFLLMLVYMPQALTLKFFLVIPALFLLMLNGLWIGLVLGIVAARFRDIQQLVQSIVQVSMFVTPLFWPPDSLAGMRRLFFVTLNPLYHLLAIARDPLLDRWPSLSSYLAVLFITLLGWCLAFVLFHSFRKRIAYWL
jgi:ABC-type polysaccharide/polyol phosphate export permease